MIRKYKQLLVVVGVIASMMATVLPASPVGAINVFSQCSSNSGAQVCQASQKDQLPSMVQIVINILLTVLGMIAVVMIVIGGIRYTTSNGDASSVKAAKDTILYAVVGLIVAIMSYAIVNFVLGFF